MVEGEVLKKFRRRNFESQKCDSEFFSNFQLCQILFRSFGTVSIAILDSIRVEERLVEVLRSLKKEIYINFDSIVRFCTKRGQRPTNPI